MQAVQDYRKRQGPLSERFFSSFEFSISLGRGRLRTSSRNRVSAAAGMGPTGWRRDKLEFGSGLEPEVLTEHTCWYPFEFVMVAGVVMASWLIALVC